MMMGMAFFKRLYEMDTPAVRLIRNWGMKQVNTHSIIKGQMITYASGLSQHVPKVMQKKFVI